jgi:hypothetical protein
MTSKTHICCPECGAIVAELMGIVRKDLIKPPPPESPDEFAPYYSLHAPSLKVTDLQDIVREKMEMIFAQREQILTAFIAEFGFLPVRAVQVEVKQPDGTSAWFVRQMTDEEWQRFVDQSEIK